MSRKTNIDEKLVEISVWINPKIEEVLYWLLCDSPDNLNNNNESQPTASVVFSVSIGVWLKHGRKKFKLQTSLDHFFSKK